jgi:hypothetical protein
MCIQSSIACMAPDDGSSASAFSQAAVAAAVVSLEMPRR